jgi:hypothetical protein
VYCSHYADFSIHFNIGGFFKAIEHIRCGWHTLSEKYSNDDTYKGYYTRRNIILKTREYKFIYSGPGFERHLDEGRGGEGCGDEPDLKIASKLGHL